VVADNIGETLRASRRARGLTIAQLSEASGVSKSHLKRIEGGDARLSAGVLLALAKPLGCTEMELLKLAGYLSPDATDDRVAKLKEAVRDEITGTMNALLERVDGL